MTTLEKNRSSIARKVRSLRTARGWTQRELATHLSLSQSRLSELENGNGSFSAEHLLALLQLFNVSVTEFQSTPARTDPADQLQNALVRHGARHLFALDQVLPAEQLDDLHAVLQETLLSPHGRFLTALAPVIALQIDVLDLHRLARRLIDIGFERRLYWLLDNIVIALQRELTQPLPREWIARYRRAAIVLQTFLSAVAQHASSTADLRGLDLLDPIIRSQQTVDELRRAGSEASERWGIVTSLQPDDFASALAQARFDA